MIPSPSMEKIIPSPSMEKIIPSPACGGGLGWGE